jgi:hypothetical protein
VQYTCKTHAHTENQRRRRESARKRQSHTHARTDRRAPDRDITTYTHSNNPHKRCRQNEINRCKKREECLDQHKYVTENESRTMSMSGLIFISRSPLCFLALCLVLLPLPRGCCSDSKSSSTSSSESSESSFESSSDSLEPEASELDDKQPLFRFVGADSCGPWVMDTLTEYQNSDVHSTQLWQCTTSQS